jgi:hypothetical protein
MHNGRFRLMASLAGATLCLFAVSANSQTPTTTPAPTSTGGTYAPDAQGTGNASTPTTGTTDPNAAVTAPQAATPTDNATTVTGTGTDVTTTTTTTRSFPGGFWGIIAVAVIVLLILFSLFRGRDRTVVRDTYSSTTNTVPVSRNVSTGTAVGDRTLSPRTASDTGTTNNPGGPNDPNTRL